MKNKGNHGLFPSEQTRKKYIDLDQTNLNDVKRKKSLIEIINQNIGSSIFYISWQEIQPTAGQYRSRGMKSLNWYHQ